MIITDTFDRQIEEYKKELMKYAKKNGYVYAGVVDGFKERKPEPPEEPKQTLYDARYVSNRPMPTEYMGDNDIETQTQNTANENYNDFIKMNGKIGKLRVQTYASEQVFPIQNAKVTVEKEFSDGKHIFAEEFTDIDGVAENITLPTRSRELSLTPDTPIPYSTYTVKVFHPGFNLMVFHNVPIFEGIESLQPVGMLPKNGNGETQITEEEPDL
ncbi:MAG: hypothetical protein IIW48_05450 [Clostridia bacterium]|nr:hypothetical protein [Clostridia bacterium]